MRTIHVVNASTLVSDDQVATAVAAVQRQVSEHFAPSWGVDAVLSPETKGYAGGGETIVLADDSDQPGALGYHTVGGTYTPGGFVFVRDSGAAWPATLSHEVLERLADADCNTLQACNYKGVATAVACEVGDPVEGDSYDVDGTAVSNFITPAWFLDADTSQVGKYDYAGNLTAPLTMTAGGYVSYTTDLANYKSDNARGEDRGMPDHDDFTRLGRRLAAL